MITENKVIEIFCIMDEFCRNFASECEKNLLGILHLVRGEIQLPFVSSSIHRIPYSHNHKTSECFGVCFQSVKSAIVHFVFGTPGGVQIFKVNLSVMQFWASAFSCPFFQSRIKQYGIIPETAYYMEIIFAQRLDKSCL